MSPKIKYINGRLGELATEWKSFDLRQYSDNRHVFRRETISFVHSSDVIGRDEDKENIISMLMKQSEDQNVPVIPIVGLGGLGKTTLAQLAFNDDRVTSLFPLKIWICVSEEFDLSRLLKLIIQSNLLNDKKFLLVLDDVWNENKAKWVELRNLLRSTDGFSPNKIIVTTRSLNVASIMSSIPPYILKGLPLEDCLTLFTKWAFNDGDERHYPNLIRIGEEIVKKCKGVPLAVRTLGSLLFQKTDESDWIYIRENEIWRLEQHENDILPVLKLSYNHLPSHLQRCLVFLSLYKKDEIYYSDRVICLWMANGLLEHPKQNQEWEDVGKRYLNKLLSRCLIQKEEDFHLKFTFKMHDLVHDLALAYLRALELRDSLLTALPNSIGNLKHLRELDLARSEDIRELPRSFYKLYCLQSLNLGATKCLPEGMQYLKSLRTLLVSYCHSLVSLPRSLKFLTKLEHLEIVRCLRINMKMELEEEEDKDLQLSLKTFSLFGLHELRDLPRLLLQGSSSTLQQLRIRGCPNLSFLPAWLPNLTSLQKLEIANCINLSALPEGIDRLTNLKELRIYGCPELSKRYRENGGKDWHKIAHIQKIQRKWGCRLAQNCSHPKGCYYG
ncbi:hypothetical protein V6Z12_D13G239700 [Gossypium hirsutum]